MDTKNHLELRLPSHVEQNQNIEADSTKRALINTFPDTPKEPLLPHISPLALFAQQENDINTIVMLFQRLFLLYDIFTNEFF